MPPKGFEQTGKPMARVDGRAKVTGAARYAAEALPTGLAYAYAVQSTIAHGRVRSIDTSAAERLPGVLAIITHENAPRLARPTLHPAGQSLPVLQSPVVEYSGQHLGVAVAETWEQARAAARLIRVEYEAAAPEVFAERLALAMAPPSGQTSRYTPAISERGDANRALGESATTLDETYRTPIYHHNPMETHASLAWWDGDRLTVHDATENTVGTRDVLAQVFRIERDQVRVFTDFVGGSFGSKGQSWPNVILAAMAAQRAGRPVKLTLTRAQMFTSAGHRSPTVQKLTMGAEADGTLKAVRHDSITHTSQFDEFVEPCGQHTETLYSCPNVAVSHRMVRAHVGTPTFTRGPGETPGSFALESAMDELAWALKMDPLAHREKCYAELDEHENRPWSTKALRECYQVAAQKFGWEKRSPRPASMREGRWLIGYGMATTTLVAAYRKAEARGIFREDGTVRIECATHEIGVGNYTILTQLAADGLNVPPELVTIHLGDSRFPPTPRGGSPAASSVGSAVFTVARELRAELVDLALLDQASPLHGLKAAEIEVKDGVIFDPKNPARGEPFTEVLRRRGLRAVEAEATAQPGTERGQPSAGSLRGGSTERSAEQTDPEKLRARAQQQMNKAPEAGQPGAFSFHSFGAHFCEVRVDPQLGVARVVRWVGAFDCGRVLNPRTAGSQIRGGIVWGIGNALMEETLQDARFGRYVNHDLAEYHIPTCADIPEMEVYFVGKEDERANPIGTKSAGELGNVGSAAAVANAVFHATGLRIRDLPITPDKLLA